MNVGVWIKAYRLRTLPLALSSTIMGSFLAYAQGMFSWSVCILTALTTLFLQILSNLANDYGDSVHGVDNANRVGPGRVVQSGKVSRNQMVIMIGIFIFLSLVSGTSLILVSLKNAGGIILFFILGLAAIIAAIKYTVGKNPYGYVGFGDLFVFLFFGIVGVAGTFYLHSHSFDPWVLLPASTIGLLSSGVLNLNNMRDIVNDTAEGKRTLVVRIGAKNAKFYHVTLITLSMIFSFIYTLRYYHSIYQLLFVLTIPLFIINLRVVIQNTEPVELNNELKKLALSTFVFTVTFGLGLVIQ